MLTMNADNHASDGDLVALLDGDESLARPGIETHVDSCATCSARLAQLQERSSRLGELLSAIEVPSLERAHVFSSARIAPAATRLGSRRALWSRPGVRAAAATLLLAGVAMASPARGWILDRVGGRQGVVTRQSRTVVTPRRVRSSEQGPASVVRFPSESDELLITFDARPVGGTLVIVAGEDNRISAQVVTRSRGEAFLVLPSELRIRNATESLADYLVTVSPTVHRVRVRLGAGDQEIASVQVTSGMRHSIALSTTESVR